MAMFTEKWNDSGYKWIYIPPFCIGTTFSRAFFGVDAGVRPERAGLICRLSGISTFGTLSGVATDGVCTKGTVID
jgi:hypothetical protein